MRVYQLKFKGFLILIKMENIEEIWKDVVGYEGYYQISNLGRIKSLNYGKNGYAKILKNSFIASYKYYQIKLYKDTKSKILKVHRLLAQAFIPNPENKPCINHIDGDKLNNDLSNLEWCTYSENIQHAFDTGLKGTSAELIEKIRKANSKKIINIKTGEVFSSITETSNINKISYSALSNRLHGRVFNDTGFRFKVD